MGPDRCMRLFGALAIDLSPMANFVDRDLASVVVNFIDHPIAPLPDAVPIIVPRQFLRTMRSGIRYQRGNLGNDARAIGFGSYRLKLLTRRGLDCELI